MKVELSHDLLAKKIFDLASTEDKMLIKVSNFIKNRFAYFKENSVLLSKEDMEYIRPYLPRITLEKHELIFIQRSQQAIWIRRSVMALIVVAVIFVIAYFMNRTEKVKLQNQERLAKEIQKYKAIEQEAKQLSTALIESRAGLDATKEELRLALLKLQKKNDTLVHSYATYKVEQDYSKEQLLTDLHIAQSAKLSELAAPIASKDKKYAFQLAVKAWHLNPNNQQAMEIIYKCGNVKRGKSLSKQRTRNIIKANEKAWGKLSSKEMRAIFAPENKITAISEKNSSFSEKVKKISQKPPPPPTKAFIPPQQMAAEVEDQVQKIQKELQQQIQQQEQNESISFPK
ncbi:hypothetical protein [Aureispira anguillae]|uniref:Uncharacterized protein n=1 Tax=Aureispira anguillae TaxID=2864201 RepID=A0A915Y9W2_9BACT|nr:hypothetical protein [Aureispira anguillae]BDS09524.1 hypothetical protein AsAng_0002250 [Aureispira anguillae]